MAVVPRWLSGQTPFVDLVGISVFRRRGEGWRRVGRGGPVLTTAIAAIAALTLAPVSASTAPARATSDGTTGPRVIIDTDLSRWWDDASAIGIANVLEKQGKLRILGVVSDVPNAVAVAAIDAIDTAYRHPNIPLGAVAGSASDTFQHGYTDELVRRLPSSVHNQRDVPAAVALYRRLLAGQPDHSVTIVSIGGYTNLAGLLASKKGPGSSLDGRRLIEKKVKRLVQMDGIFPRGRSSVHEPADRPRRRRRRRRRSGMADADRLGRRARRRPDQGRRHGLRLDGPRSSDARRRRRALRVRPTH